MANFSWFKSLILALFSFLLVSLLPQSAKAFLAENSADLKATQPQLPVKEEDQRVEKLAAFLNHYHSPLVPFAEMIVETADEYQIPWHLLVAISGVESTFCHAIPYASYNCWGWRNGDHVFADYEKAIKTISKALKVHYFDRGLDDPFKIAPVYAPPSKTWGRKVFYFMNQMENFSPPVSFILQFSI